MHTVTKVDSLERFEALEPIWNNLLDGSEHATIFQTFEWIHSWWQTLGADHHLYILVVKTGDKVIGIAPLMLIEHSFLGHKRRTIRFIGSPESDYCDFIGKDKAIITQKVIEYMLKRRSDWTAIDLSQISERSPTVGILNDCLESQSCTYRVKAVETCLSFKFEGNDEQRAAFAPRRNKKLRNCINYFEKSGSLALEEIRDATEVERRLFNFFHFHIVRWDGTSTPSRFLEPRHRNFFLALVKRLAPEGRISMLVLKHRGLPVAYEFNLDYRNTICLYTPTHNVFYNKKSPGTIMNTMLCQYYVRKGYAELDFTRGGEAYKGILTNREYSNYQMKVYRGRIGYNLSVWYDKAKAPWPVQKLIQNRRFIYYKAKAIWFYRSHGLVGLLWKVAKKTARLFIDYRTVLIFDHRERPEIPEPKLDVEFKKLDKSHVEEIASFLGAESDSEKHRAVVEKFEKNSDCFACYYNGHIVSTGWGVFHEDIDPEDGFALAPKNHQVVFSDGFTSPVCRGLGIRRFCVARELDYYHRQGLECIAAIDKTNVPSLRMTQKLNFKNIRSVRQLRILGVKIL